MTTIADYIASASISIRNSQFISVPEFFHSDEIVDKDYFDDSYRKTNQYSYPTTGSINSGSIDTSQFDAYRQGVELTNIKYWDVGIVKIHIGEPGHVKRPNQFGILRRDYLDTVCFNDNDPIDAITRIQQNITTKDVVDNSDVSFVANGCIEPLTIRDIVSFHSKNINEPHAIRASVEQGNEYNDWSTDLIVQTQEYYQVSSISPFYDSGNTLGGFINVELNSISNMMTPFYDTSILYREHTLSNNFSNFMRISLLNLQFTSTGSSTDTYVKEDHETSTTGWTYNSSNKIKVDSIAFGELLQ